MKHEAITRDAQDVSDTFSTITTVSEGQPISANVVMPATPIQGPPLLALHGISREAQAMTTTLAGEATNAGRVLVVPHFTRSQWPVFQRINRKNRPDRALLALLAALRSDGLVGDEPVDLFGFSGGAQLAHRFTMVYPEVVNRLHLGAAGWYTLPDGSLPYPMGLNARKPEHEPWVRRMMSGLGAYLDREITVYVGREDRLRDKTLRQDPVLNRAQGVDRVGRARRYVAILADLQRRRDLPVTARLELLDDCGHDFVDCSVNGGLARAVVHHI